MGNTSIAISNNNGITLKDLKDLIERCDRLGFDDSTIVDLDVIDIGYTPKCKSIIADEESIRFYDWNN